MINNSIVTALFFAAFGLATEASAQVVKPNDVQISMGLVPVYELSRVGGCPYLLAAPSPQWYNLSYKRCPSDAPIVITESLDRLRVNEIMKNVCEQNIREKNGCEVELIVQFPDMTLTYPTIEESIEE